LPWTMPTDEGKPQIANEKARSVGWRKLHDLLTWRFSTFGPFGINISQPGN